MGSVATLNLSKIILELLITSRVSLSSGSSEQLRDSALMLSTIAFGLHFFADTSKHAEFLRMLRAEIGEFHFLATPTLAEFDGARVHNHQAFVADRDIFYKEKIIQKLV